MSKINQVEYKDKKREFFERLEALMYEYPELMEKPEFKDEYRGIVEEEPCLCGPGFNKDAPKMLTNVVVILTTKNSEDWEELFWTTPYGQSNFATAGAVELVGRMM